MNSTLLSYFNGNELAASVWSSKYAMKGEVTPDDMHRRMAKELAIEMQKFDPKYTEDYIFEQLNNFESVVPQGSIMAMLGNSGQVGSLSNCFVVESPHDSYSGILATDESLVQLMKRRGGVGVDISTLRPRSSRVNNAAGSSTGAASFMERFSNTTREVAQEGRRGALMLTIDVRHPDVEEFVNIKKDRSKVTGANISVQLRDEFMEAVRADADYTLRWPCDRDIHLFMPPMVDGKAIDVKYGEIYEVGILEHPYKSYPIDRGYIKRVRAKDLYEQIVHNAWENAEPGLMFKDRHIQYSPDGVYDDYRFVTTNPCFSYDTPLLTAQGYVPIGSLEDEEVDLVNKDGDIVPGVVYKSGQKPIYEIRLTSKRRIRTTISHKFMLVDSSEKQAQHLVRGDRLMPFYKINQETNEFTKFGFIQGDGCLGRLDSTAHLGMEINLGENDLDVCKLFEVNDAGKHYIRGYNEVLKELGFSSAALPDRMLPSTIDDWDEQNVLMFLKGLWSANGSIISGHRIAFKSTCKGLIEELQKILIKFGIESYFTTNKPKEVAFSNGTYLCKESYDLNIGKFQSVLRFAELIGFVHTYKQNALEDLIKAKAPMFLSGAVGEVEDVYDFTLYDNTHWGVIDGVIAHNCGEIGMSPWDACRLLALNLYTFVNNKFEKNASVDYDAIMQASYFMQIAADAIVSIELKHIDRIIAHIRASGGTKELRDREISIWAKIRHVAESSRRTGCGFTALGDALAALNLKYDSDEGIETASTIMKTMLRGELSASIDLAKKFGPFRGWDPDKENNEFFDMLKSDFPDLWRDMQKFGRRNVSWSTVAPTGSVSILTQTSSGMEPMFRPFYTRRKKVNANDGAVRVDFTDQNGDNWQEYPVMEPRFKEWLEWKGVEVSSLTKESADDYFAKSPWYGSTSEDIDWIKRVQMQAVIQRYVTHSISSTINLPNSASAADVAAIYDAAWRTGLKGVTVYRDGCRSGVLVTETTTSEFATHDAPKRPKRLDGELHHTVVSGTPWTVAVGLMNNKPYEIFASEGKWGDNGQLGFIEKHRRGLYAFVVGDETIIPNVLEGLDDNAETVTRLISTSLRHGAAIDFVVEQLGKTSGSVVSPAKALARVLRKYAKQEHKAACSDCGSQDVERSEGCLTCKNCGSSKCS